MCQSAAGNNSLDGSTLFLMALRHLPGGHGGAAAGGGLSGVVGVGLDAISSLTPGSLSSSLVF